LPVSTDDQRKSDTTRVKNNTTTIVMCQGYLRLKITILFLII